MNTMIDSIRQMPKAELHMHIEGSLEPEMMLDMARRNGISLPWDNVQQVRAAYAFDNLQGFLDIFYQGLTVLLTEEDFFDVTLAYLRRANDDNIVHAELFLSPQAHLRRGVSLDTMMGGVLRAFDVARAEFGMSAALIAVLQRHLPEEDALRIIDRIAPWRGSIVGIGLGGAEVGNPPAKFARLFDHCRRLGYRLTAHAGEEGPADYVRDTVDLLKVDRIDHGVRAGDDDALLARLARERIPLTVCPVGNVRLAVFPKLGRHNLPVLMERGLTITVNSDDPAYFGAYMNDMLERCVRDLGLSYAAVFELVANGFRASFLPEDQKAACLAKLEPFRHLAS